jgi:hypothetical protein
MKVLLGKLTPTLAVMALVGYCCWPTESSPVSGGSDKGGGKKLEIAQERLCPRRADDPARDPFANTFAGLRGDNKAKPSQPTVSVKSHTSASQQEAELRRLVAGLTLEGTLLWGQRREALIDGRLYAEGEPVLTGKGVRMTVSQVSTSKVVLEQGGQKFDLVFPATAVNAARQTSKRSEPANKPGAGIKTGPR